MNWKWLKLFFTFLTLNSVMFWLQQGLAEGLGHAEPGQIQMQEAATPIMESIHDFHDKLLFPIITFVCLFVFALLVYVCVRFNEKANPTPSRTTHNTFLEVAWTVVPILILIVIAIPSFRLLKEEVVVPPADMAIKVTGNQWYWDYSYVDAPGGEFHFSSNIIPDNELKSGDIRLLSVDNEVVVPINKVVRVQVTADAEGGVIHSFVIPSFGIRMDAVPGRLNETWFKAEREGVYYGQCSKICGQNHAYMPISFRVVNQEAYDTWVKQARQKFASRQDETVKFAALSVANQASSH